MQIEVIGPRTSKYTGNLLSAAPAMLEALQCALADLEGILPEFDPEQEHPAWETLAEIRAAIAKAEGKQSVEG